MRRIRITEVIRPSGSALERPSGEALCSERGIMGVMVGRQPRGNTMADEEQLRILKRGVTTWNAWRQQADRITVDLSGAYLCGADLVGADLAGPILVG
jgi:hypothetical protein